LEKNISQPFEDKSEEENFGFEWNCRRCTFLNHEALSYCEMCGLESNTDQEKTTNEKEYKNSPVEKAKKGFENKKPSFRKKKKKQVEQPEAARNSFKRKRENQNMNPRKKAKFSTFFQSF